MQEKLSIDILGKKTTLYSVFFTLFWILAVGTLVSRMAFGYGAHTQWGFWSALVTVVILAALKDRNVIGKLILHIDTLAHEKGVSFDIKNIEHLRLECQDFDGGPPNAFPKSLLVGKGSNNKISFIENGVRHSYRLLIRENQVGPINGLVKQWKEKGLSLYFRNVYGQETYQ